jgi:hypothetical protein
LSLDWLNLKRLRWGRGLNRLNLNGLLSGLSRQSLRRVELGLTRFRRGRQLGLSWELGRCGRDLALRNPTLRLLPLRLLCLDLPGGFDQRHG